MAHYGLGARSTIERRCEGRSKILDGPDKGKPGDQCKRSALPGERFCKVHLRLKEPDHGH